MKSKKLTLVASLLSLAALAGCGKTSEPSAKPTEPAKPSESAKPTEEPEEVEIQKEAADKIISAYNPSLTGKFSFSYTANYKVDVDSHGGTGKLDNFKHEVEDTTTGDIDLTSGNVYLKISKTSKDKRLSQEASKTEALVYKDGDTYKYVTTTRENPVALASEEAAINKISDLVYSISYNLAGYITRDTFKYEGDNNYQWREFGLSSTAVVAEDCNDPYYFGKRKDGGLNIKTKVQYVGYKTDNGISDFSNKADDYAAEAVVKTNSTGLVTSYAETYNNASLDFAIRTPAPTVVITGNRNFSANYGATFEKAGTIEHHLTKSVITWDENPKCTFEVYSCPADNKASKTAIKSGDEVKVGDLLAVKVTPYGHNNIVNVALGTTSAEVSEDGFYYFEVSEGAKKLAANINGSDRKPDVQYATVTTEKGEHVKSFTVKYRTYPNTTALRDLDAQNRAPIGRANYLVLTAEFDEGYELDAFTVNGNAATNFGQWCYAIKTEGTYACKVTAKAVADTPASNDVEFTLNKDAGVKSATVSTRDNFNPSTITDVTAAGKAEAKAGRLFCVKVELKDGYQLDLVKSGKTVAGFRNGYYYFSNFAAGSHVIDIVTRAAEPAIQYVNFTIAKDDGVKSASVYTMDNFDFGGRMDYTAAKKAEAKAGRFLCVKVELKDGYEIVSVKNGEVAGNLQGGYYCFSGSTAGEVTYTIVTKASVAA